MPGDSGKREHALAGELMVVSYPASHHQVNLVPVNGEKNLDADRGEEYLNSVYCQAVVQFRVLAVDSFWVPFIEPEPSTTNLMSYGPPTATRLYKYQWYQIQQPALALCAWMEKEEKRE